MISPSAPLPSPRVADSRGSETGKGEPRTHAYDAVSMCRRPHARIGAFTCHPLLYLLHPLANMQRAGVREAPCTGVFVTAQFQMRR
jgi:hypothetical protein